MFRHNVGDKAKDKLTGMTGIIVSRSEHLYGCNRYWLSPQELKDGKPVDGQWFDEDQIDVIEAAAIKSKRYRVVDEDVEAVAPPLRKAGGPSSQPAVSTGPNTR